MITDATLKVYAKVDNGDWQELESHAGHRYPLDFLGKFKKIKFRIRHNETATKQLKIIGWDIKTFPCKTR